MHGARLERFGIGDEVQGEVEVVALLPNEVGVETPLCLFLYGGGGSAETLAEIRGLIEAWWASGTVRPMVVATPEVGPLSFYLDDPARGTAWETFTADVLPAALRRRYGAAALPRSAGLVGISMGGYGALKIAFARPTSFGAVAAVSPMIEPAEEAAAVPLRNRFHYPAGVPAALLGAERDADLYRRDHPAGRVRRGAEAIRASGLAISIDAAGEDAVHAHDGAEHLHRVLWELDIAHEYRLHRDRDHVGEGLVDRLEEAFAFAGRHLAPVKERGADPARDALRAHLAPLRAEAERRDPSLRRRYGSP